MGPLVLALVTSLLAAGSPPQVYDPATEKQVVGVVLLRSATPPRLIAREVTKGRSSLILRDERGRGAWEPRASPPGASPP